MALIYYKELQKKGLQLFSFFLPLIFLQELTLFVLDKLNADYYNNALVYNIYRIVTVVVFAVLYYRIPFMQHMRKWIRWISISYLLIVLVNYVFIESMNTTSSYTSLLRGFVITIFAVLFLYGYFNLDNRSEEKNWQPVLWITIGVVSFYPVVSISLAFQKFLAADNATLYGYKLYQLIPRLMSILMYSCFSYAFYLCQKKK